MSKSTPFKLNKNMISGRDKKTTKDKSLRKYVYKNRLVKNF